MSDELNIEREFLSAYEQKAQEIGRFNLAVFGKTGVGKSSLINAVFREDVAPTGIGQPVTQGHHIYIHKGGFLGIVDTQGLEIGVNNDELIAELGAYVKAMRDEPLTEQVHVAWYCVRANDRRFEDTEADFVRRLHALDLPVIMVLTQVPTRDGEPHPDAVILADHIESLSLPIYSGRPLFVMATGDPFFGPSHGLVDLLDATFQVAPDGVANALIAAQKIDMARKHSRAVALIAAASTAAAATGAVPLPFADAALLVPVQLSLMASIATTYGVKPDVASVAALVATSVATNAGRSAVVGLLKLIPGAGTLVGGVISAAVASTLTAAIGYSWAEVCKQLSLGKLTTTGGAVDAALVKRLFDEGLKAWFSKLGVKSGVTEGDA